MRRQAGDRGDARQSEESSSSERIRAMRDQQQNLRRRRTLRNSCRQYGCGPIQFAGTDNALYERHLAVRQRRRPDGLPAPRERFEAVARSVRDILSQRWVQTEKTYERAESQARLLPVDGVSHRPLAGQQCHQPAARSAGASRPSSRRTSTGSSCSSRNPTPAWATAGSGAWRRASSTRWRRCSSRPWATGCATSTASSSSRSRTAGSSEAAGQLAAPPGPWEVARPHEQVEVKLNCSFELRGGSLARRSPAGRPA